MTAKRIGLQQLGEAVGIAYRTLREKVAKAAVTLDDGTKVAELTIHRQRVQLVKEGRQWYALAGVLDLFDGDTVELPLPDVEPSPPITKTPKTPSRMKRYW